ncbi:MAG: type II toxin-antitoxin system VapC family toxin [Chloroflexi bacterium]|nr:type II toxin-antitoxin system VapC family toxin [Chloroflexota bacterium]
MTVIDASVYIALVNEDELGFSVSWQWMQTIQSSRVRLAAPAIMIAEAAAAISRGKGDIVHARKIIWRLQHSRLIEFWPISLTLAHRSAEIAADYRIRGCDAVYLALAEQLGTDLVSLDRQQVARGTAVVPTRHP